MRNGMKNGMTRLVFAVLGIFLLSFAAVADASTVQYRYDELDRLYRAEYEDGTVIEYVYDNVGNRISQRIVDVTPPVTIAVPPGGQYLTGVTVALSCSDGAGSGCDRIYYTLDGTIPTTASPIYSSPLPMAEGGTILKYFAVDRAGNTETVKTQNYVLDSIPPVTTAAPPGGAYGMGQTVTLTCNDGAGSGCDRIYYTLDNTTPTTSSPVYIGPLTMATATNLRYFSTDHVGNAEAVRMETYFIDDTPPTTTASPAGGTYYIVTVALTCIDGTGSGCDKIYYTLDNTTPTTSSPVYVTLLPISTTSTLRYFAVDRTGNPEPAKSATYVIDNTAPTVTAVNPPDGSIATASTTISATFSEAMNPATITSGSFTVSRFVGFKTVAGGAHHTVALKNDGMVVAWGDDSYGQSTVPVGLSEVVAIATGPNHSLAVRNDGTVVAWGANWSGQSTVPAGLSGVVSIATNYSHTVALKNDGTVVAWGDDSYGQCTVPAGLSGVVAIAAGQCHSVALKNDGTVVAWGSNDYGVSTVPAGLSGVVAVAAGYMHTVALKSDGTMVAWGTNYSGESTVPANLFGVVAVAAGYLHTVAAKSDGTVVAWGLNHYGQSTVPTGLSGVVAVAAGQYNSLALKYDGTMVAWGSNDAGESTVPVGLSGVAAVATGESHTVALKNDGTVVAWGSNQDGRSTVPVGLSEVVAVAAGTAHNVVLKNDGTVVAWGYDGFGQSTVPTDLSGGVAVAASAYHSLALKNDGTVVAWGDNYSTVPVDLSGVVAIAAGYQHCLALKNDGTVVAWGFNLYGQSTVPAGLSGVVAVAGGQYHSVALKSDGAVVAWGSNDYGESTVPTGLSGVVAIAAGYGHSVALKGDGTVVAWGAATAFSPLSPYETAVEGIVTYDNATATATFTPVALLSPDVTYFATVNTGARSATDVPLAADVRWSFTVFYPPVVLTASAGAGGSISPSGNVTVDYGSSQTFTITPSANYHVTAVTVDNVSVAAVTSYTFDNVTTNHTISATFGIDTRTITASAGAGGSISPSGNVTLNYGASQTFAITPNTGYAISNVVVDNTSRGAISTYTFNNVTTNHTISATFVFSTVMVLSPNGGEVTPSGGIYTIRWGAPATAVKFNLAYTLNNSSYTTIANGVTGTTYNWTVPKPSANSPLCKIRVVGLNSSNQTVGTDFSDGNFTIEVVRLTAPNGGGGQTLRIGTSVPMTWITNGTSKSVNKVKLSYSTNGGSNWTAIATVTGNPGTYNWTVPNSPGNTCKARVELLNNNTAVCNDASDQNFTIAP